MKHCQVMVWPLGHWSWTYCLHLSFEWSIALWHFCGHLWILHARSIPLLQSVYVWVILQLVDLPWFGAATIRTVLLKVRWFSHHTMPVRMLRAGHGQAIVHIPVGGQGVKQRLPCCCPFGSGHEGLRIADQDECFAGTRQQHIQSLGRGHEANITICITSCETDNYNIAFLTLIIIW